MSLDEPKTIDIIATDPTTGKLLLVMTEERPWDGRPMFEKFLAKVGTYVSYAMSDQFRVDHPGRTPSDVVVKLDCAFPPDAGMQSCMADLPAKLGQYGIGFACEVFEDDIDDEVEERQSKPWWRFW